MKSNYKIISQSLWEFLSRWKLSTAPRVFTDLLSNSPKCLPRFSPGYEGTDNMFYFLNIEVSTWKVLSEDVYIRNMFLGGKVGVCESQF